VVFANETAAFYALCILLSYLRQESNRSEQKMLLFYSAFVKMGCQVQSAFSIMPDCWR